MPIEPERMFILTVSSNIAIDMKFLDEVLGYSRIEYLSVFISFLYAFIVAEFFTGWARMLRSRNSLNFSFSHTFYTILFFWILILNWYSLWTQMELLSKGFLYFILICIPITLAYFAAVLMFPDLDKTTNLDSYFHENFKAIGLTTSIFILLNLVIAIGVGSVEVLSATTLIRSLIGLLILSISILNLRSLILPVGILIAIGLIIGSIKMASF